MKYWNATGMFLIELKQQVLKLFFFRGGTKSGLAIFRHEGSEDAGY